MSARLSAKRTGEDIEGWRLPAKPVEKIVIDTVHQFLQGQIQLMDALHLEAPTVDELRALQRFTIDIAQKVSNNNSVMTILHRVRVLEDKLQIDLDITT